MERMCCSCGQIPAADVEERTPEMTSPRLMAAYTVTTSALLLVITVNLLSAAIAAI